MNTRKTYIFTSVIAAVLLWGADQVLAQFGPNPAVDYTKPNYAYSPPLRKFVDSLPGLGPTATNNLGNYIPVANKMTDPSGNGDDYYEIGLFDYTWKFHSDLPPTKVRGYRDLSPASDGRNHYLGPVIVATRNKPVRMKFSNRLGVNGAGDLFIPVDETIMGAGMGPYGATPPRGPANYSQNRANIHLHGIHTAWISDGTPHQWITPNGETTSYTNGVSHVNVPDMPNPGPGALTLYYPNDQSARLMFYHDHAYGITRLNVYAGEAAGYILQDAAGTGEWTLPATAGQIPLIIQDKTFVCDATTLTATNATRYTKALDPLWDLVKWGAGGSLWFPHVYMPNQDPTSADGTNPFGRWDYGPWFWPPQLSGTTPGSLQYPTPPTVSATPEAFMDTPVVNGTAYPYIEVEPTAYRLRILNACNDRALNLSLFCAKTNAPMWDAVSGALLNPDAGEINMVPSVPNAGLPATWPTDGRDGGVPDPAAAGPSFYQIGTEGGLLPQVAVIPPQPVNYEYFRRSITVLNISDHGLLMMPAERADVIVDFSQFAGKTVILYNDAPAPVPAYDTRLDFYTGNPDQTPAGGAPSTPPGYGPNTRTIMQFRVKTVAQQMGSITVANGGTGYIAPVVHITGGSPTVNATAVATVSAGNLSGVTIVNDGSGYAAPQVHITGGGAWSNATAVANVGLWGDIQSITITSPGAGYTSAPTITITDPMGFGFAGTGVITPVGAITGIALTNPGAGYRGIPTVTITDPTGTGVVAVANLVGAPPPAAYNLAALQAALPTAYLATQPPPVVPQLGYPGAYKGSSNTYVRIQYNNLTFKPVGSATNVTFALEPKCIQELFDPYGRMNSTLGVELPITSITIQTTIPYGYVDPATEEIPAGGTQLWKITHNGVDTHGVHFHHVNVQVINRVGWDGTIKPPDANELGWKDTVRMNPLEDIVVAMRMQLPTVPFAVPDSIRPLDPTQPIGGTMNFTGVDPNGNPTNVVNEVVNFGWEYVWHCHILGHEENDMMRPFIMRVGGAAAPAAAPAAMMAAAAAPAVQAAVVPVAPVIVAAPVVQAVAAPAAQAVVAAPAAAPVAPTSGGGGVAAQFAAAAPTGQAAVLEPVTQAAAAPATQVVAAPVTQVAAAAPATQPVAAVAVSAPVVKTGAVTPVVQVASAAPAVPIAVTTVPKQIVAKATTAGPSVPPVPTNLRTTTTQRVAITIAWTAPASAQGIRVQRSSNGGATWTQIAQGPAGATMFQDNGLTAGTTYLYRVQAFNAAGSSAWSTPFAKTTLP